MTQRRKILPEKVQPDSHLGEEATGRHRWSGNILFSVRKRTPANELTYSRGHLCMGFAWLGKSQQGVREKVQGGVFWPRLCYCVGAFPSLGLSLSIYRIGHQSS